MSGRKLNMTQAGVPARRVSRQWKVVAVQLGALVFQLVLVAAFTGGPGARTERPPAGPSDRPFTAD